MFPAKGGIMKNETKNVLLLAAFLAGNFIMITDASAWWDGSWQYRKPITINGSTSLLNDYQINLSINSTGIPNMNWSAYGNDTRFTWMNASSGLEQNISFWIEEWNNASGTGNATLWIKAPNITASTVANTTVYLYYGKSGATYNNSLGGNSTFLLFDDFNNGAVLDSGKWVNGTNAPYSIGSGKLRVLRHAVQSSDTVNSKQSYGDWSVVRSKLQMPWTTGGASYAQAIFGYMSNSIPQAIEIIGASSPAEKDTFGMYNTGWNYIAISSNDNEHYYEIRRTNNVASVYSDNILLSSNGTQYPSNSLNVSFQNQKNSGSDNFYVDWIFVRNYSSLEPLILSLGAEETIPKWSANSSKISSPQTFNGGATYGFQINWTDSDFANATFQLGRPSGTLANYTKCGTGICTNNNSAAGPRVWHINFTQDQFGPVGTYNYTWFGIDAAGNQNSSDTVGYTISIAPALARLFLNGTEGNRNYNLNDMANFTVALNITGTAYLNANITGWVLQSGATPLSNYTRLQSEGTFNITGYFPGNENYSSSSATYFVSIITCSSNSLSCTTQQYPFSGWIFDPATGNLSGGGNVKMQVKETGDVFATTFSGGYFSISPQFCLVPGKIYTFILQAESGGRSAYMTYKRVGKAGASQNMSCTSSQPSCSFQNYSVSGLALDSQTGSLIGNGTAKISVDRTGDSFAANFTGGSFSLTPQFCLTQGTIYNFLLSLEGQNRHGFITYRRMGK